MKALKVLKLSVSLLIAAALMLMACSALYGCGGTLPKGDDSGTSEVETPTPGQTIKIFEDGATRYKIIWPTGAPDDEYNAYFLLARAFAACGVNIKNLRDDMPDTGDGTGGDYEILIGGTNREESTALTNDLKSDDYVIALSGTKLVIAGGSPASTLEAAKKFISDYLPGETTSLSLPDDLLIKNSLEYPVAGFIINDVPISQFKVIRPAGANKLELYALSLLSEALQKRLGEVLVSQNDVAPEADHEIRIGATSRSGDAPGDYEYIIEADGGSINIKGGKHAIVAAVLSFIDTYIPGTSETAVSVKIGGEGQRVSTANKALPAEVSIDGKNLVALCDQKNASVVVIDLDAPDPTAPSAVVWNWKPTAALGFTSTSGYSNSVDEAILRYSEVLNSYVVCVTSSAGFVGVVKYPSGERVWSGTASGLSPHSIEYLPEGHIAVACSGGSSAENGCIRLYTASQGVISGKYISVPLASAHGVIWDDKNQLLWTLGSTELRAYRIGGTEKSPELIQVDGMGGNISFSGGHNLSVNPADPDLLWISGSKGVCQYRKSTGSFIINYTGAVVITSSAVKSIDSFPDGRVVRVVAANVYKAHDTDRLAVFSFDGPGNPTRHEYVFSDRAFYKARRFSAQYS